MLAVLKLFTQQEVMAMMLLAEGCLCVSGRWVFGCG